MYITPEKDRLYKLLNSGSANSTDRKRWKNMLLDMSQSGSISLPSSGMTGSWWTITVAIVSVLTMLNKITDKDLERMFTVLNILDGTLGGADDEIRGFTRSTKVAASYVENLEYAHLRRILIKCGISSDVFKSKQMTHHMSLKDMYFVGRLKEAVKEICDDIGTETSQDALTYFNKVFKEHYKMTSMFSSDMTGRRLSYTNA